jgi:hypothetical protein
MSLFTIVLDYRGGTYIHQVRAASALTACRKWARELSVADIYNLGRTGKEDMVTQLENDKAIPLEDAKNAWCFCVTARGKLALINVIKTDQSA